jgi:hypothetical protein
MEMKRIMSVCLMAMVMAIVFVGDAQARNVLTTITDGQTIITAVKIEEQTTLRVDNGSCVWEYKIGESRFVHVQFLSARRVVITGYELHGKTRVLVLDPLNPLSVKEVFLEDCGNILSYHYIHEERKVLDIGRGKVLLAVSEPFGAYEDDSVTIKLINLRNMEVKDLITLQGDLRVAFGWHARHGIGRFPVVTLTQVGSGLTKAYEFEDGSLRMIDAFKLPVNAEITDAFYTRGRNLWLSKPETSAWNPPE